MKRIKNKSSFPTWGMALKTWSSRTSPYPPLATTICKQMGKQRAPLSPFLLILLLFFLFFFFFLLSSYSCSCSWTFLPFSPPYLCSLLPPITGSFAKEQGDTCGHLCHGPHFVGVGRKQRLHPVELLIILPVVLRIFFFFITSHNDLFGNSRTKPYCLWFSEPSVAYKSCRLCKWLCVPLYLYSLLKRSRKCGNLCKITVRTTVLLLLHFPSLKAPCCATYISLRQLELLWRQKGTSE